MDAHPATVEVRQIGVLLRGEPDTISGWIQEWSPRRTCLCVLVIFAGTGLYGGAVGCWRDPVQAYYTAIKFPLIILLTTLGNAVLNGMLAPLLGLNLGFRQSLQANLLSFTIAAVILGSFSPLIFFMVWNAPPVSAQATAAYSFILLADVMLIAFAGLMANLRLVRLLQRLGGGAPAGRRVLCAWLAGNLLLGSQLSWNLRPFIGSPGLPVEFLRDNAFQGNFFEAVFQSARHLLSF
jgi:hypothetical protein